MGFTAGLFCIFPCPSAKLDGGGFQVDDFSPRAFVSTFLVGLLRESAWIGGLLV